jgi:hypothetical protein
MVFLPLQIVCLDDWGCRRLTLNRIRETAAEEITASAIKEAGVIFTPGKKICTRLSTATFTKTYAYITFSAIRFFHGRKFETHQQLSFTSGFGSHLQPVGCRGQHRLNRPHLRQYGNLTLAFRGILLNLPRFHT